MRKAGQGDLYAQFERLKQKLMAEGLFDPARKREIPTFPRVIGIATSETGAAIRDIIRVARRRDPNVGIIVAPCAVQGASAAGEIVRAIERLNRNGESDVLLVGRGGGSIEDLWAFNEEAVARAIAASRIPVISCVGHEIDFTIADFVADLRAPTPSAAAELAVPMLDQLRLSMNDLLRRFAHAFASGLRMRRLQLERLSRASVFEQPERTLTQPGREALARMDARLQSTLPRLTEKPRHRLAAADASLRALNPAAVLDRGYAVIYGESGIVSGINALQPEDTVTIRLSDGSARADITSIHPEVGIPS